MSQIISICSCWVRTQAGRASPLNQDIEVPQCELPVRMLMTGCPVAAPAWFASSAGKPFCRKENRCNAGTLASGTGFPLQDPAVVLLQTPTPITVCFSQYGKPVAGSRQAGKILSQGLADFPFKASNHSWATSMSPPASFNPKLPSYGHSCCNSLIA